MAMNGDVLLDADRIAKTLTAMVATGELDPMTPAEIQAEAATVASFMQTQGDFFDNPLWTLKRVCLFRRRGNRPLHRGAPGQAHHG
jgi:hypothetical protein